jgi:4-amino-4-deoxy-L-arabinose transferase-like glycosyltransferase
MKTKYGLYAIITLGIALRVYDLFTVYAVGVDGIEYVRIAEFFTQGRFGAALKSMRMPFYPVVTACFNLVVGNMEWAGRLASFSFGLLLVLLCFLFAKKFWGEEAAIITAAATAIQPYLVRYSVLVLSESSATLLFTTSVFLFYRGWVERKPAFLGGSGFLLMLSYLTRPEYVVYFVPLTAILVVPERRYRHAGAFLFSFLFFATAFLVWIRIDTGFWVVDRRMLSWKLQTGATMPSFYYLLGSISPLAALKNLPVVAGHFCEAVYLPFLFLALLGISKTDRPYRKLVFALTAVHILARSFVPYSSKRYAVEFIPMMMIFAANGVPVFRDYFKRYQRGGLFAALVFSAAVFSAVFMGLNDEKTVRKLEREGGLLVGNSGAKVIAARLPISAFYARADWVDPIRTTQAAGNCEELTKTFCLEKVEYIFIDKSLEKEAPLIGHCFSTTKLTAFLTYRDSYIRIYKLGACDPNP